MTKGKRAEIDLFLSDGVALQGLTTDDVASFNENGMFEDRLLEKLDAHHERLVAVVEALRGLPGSGRLKVFGSASTDKEIPGDIDVYADTSGMTPAEIADLSRGLMVIARTNYSYLDPFLLVKGKLMCRNDEATGWATAKLAKQIARAGEAGVTLEGLALKPRFLSAYRAAEIGTAVDSETRPSP